jgi:hypothetical protein
MKLSFKKKAKLPAELHQTELDLRRKLMEATLAAVEQEWDDVEQRIIDARLLVEHIQRSRQ